MVQAWSIGTSKRGSDQKPFTAGYPGSGAYNPNKEQKKKAPSWKIGTSQRGNLGYSDTAGLGPGAYNIKGSTGNDGSKYTMRPKTGIKEQNENTPGSGTYNPNMYSQYKKPVAFSMGMKASMSESRLQVPGPGQYNHKGSVENRPSYKFGRDTNRNFYFSNQSPGPGSYRHDLRPNSASAPRYGFGTSQRDAFRSNQAPGPGQYESKGAMDSFYSRNSQGATMISRRNNLGQDEASRVPGPGAYEPKGITKKSAPAFKIGTSVRDSLNRSENIPGAGTYNLGWTDRPRSPAFRMGTDVRKPLNGFEMTPGPGTYNLPQRAIEGPQLTFKGVPDKDPVQKERERVPGSGTYNPSVEYTKHRPTSAKIGTAAQRAFGYNSITPGVGNYELRGKVPVEAGPKWGFGTEIQRPSSSKGFAPGPGAYTLKPTFADVPKYLIPHAQSSKYL